MVISSLLEFSEFGPGILGAHYSVFAFICTMALLLATKTVLDMLDYRAVPDSFCKALFMILFLFAI
ncbi:hypothetical protein Krac_1201 [Ktedonobacter racemifer DSM 44963]|uniref:Uncharacterized protein n=1 Tax=Ktedonobacter racemifer DSM 44963 TaxID=485913 RepID=D6U6H5_KTERA|nr:hypothetical protein Krac_1201 [Ktedonobacter racemifer DSM 44963]